MHRNNKPFRHLGVGRMQKHYPQHRKHGMATARQGCATPVLMRAGGLSLAIAASACVAALAGCASERPQSTVSPGLDSGVTSSNGGGMRATGNVLNQGVTTKVP